MKTPVLLGLMITTGCLSFGQWTVDDEIEVFATTVAMVAADSIALMVDPTILSDGEAPEPALPVELVVQGRRRFLDHASIALVEGQTYEKVCVNWGGGPGREPSIGENGTSCATARLLVVGHSQPHSRGRQILAKLQSPSGETISRLLIEKAESGWRVIQRTVEFMSAW